MTTTTTTPLTFSHTGATVVSRMTEDQFDRFVGEVLVEGCRRHTEEGKDMFKALTGAAWDFAEELRKFAGHGETRDAEMTRTALATGLFEAAAMLFASA